jgi:hypothetical protein
VHRLSFLILISLLVGGCILPAQVVQQPAASAALSAVDSVELPLLGHLCGTAMAIAVQDNYAFLGFSYEFVVLDISDHAQPQWVTALPLPTNDIVLRDQTAYVAD